MPKPKATERRSGGNSFANAARMTMNEVPDRPKPTNTPAERSSIGRAGRMRHQREAGRIHQPAGAEHPTGAVTVGDHAGSRLADAPKQVL